MYHDNSIRFFIVVIVTYLFCLDFWRSYLVMVEILFLLIEPLDSVFLSFLQKANTEKSII